MQVSFLQARCISLIWSQTTHLGTGKIQISFMNQLLWIIKTHYYDSKARTHYGNAYQICKPNSKKWLLLEISCQGSFPETLIKTDFISTLHTGMILPYNFHWQFLLLLLTNTATFPTAFATLGMRRFLVWLTVRNAISCSIPFCPTKNFIHQINFILCYLQYIGYKTGNEKFGAHLLQKRFKRKANENDSRRPREGRKGKETVKASPCLSTAGLAFSKFFCRSGEAGRKLAEVL